MKLYGWILCALLSMGAINAQAEFEESNPIQVELICEETSVRPGQPFTVALHYQLDDDWHVYWKNPGETGMPIQAEWDLPEGFTASPIQWSYPKKFTHSGITTYGYEKEVILLAEITPPKDYSGKDVSIRANLRWVACSNDMCLPGMADIEATLPVTQDTPAISDRGATIQKARKLLPQKQTVTAQKNGELVEVHLPPSVQQPIRLYFCPEENGIISEKYEPVLGKTDNHHIVVLKAAGNGKQLNGVLVLERHDGTSEAIEIATEIGKDAIEREAIGMVTLSGSSYSTHDMDLSGGFWMAIAFAFLGGVLLNLMPCVLPVVSLKILSFVKLAGENRLKTLKHGCFYALGVLISFWTLAIALLVLQAYGNAIGWGFQLQNPAFIAVLIAVIFTFSLSLFGLFEMGTSIQSRAGSAEGSGSALWSGVLATAVATPCTGPFMGTALGIAAGLSAPLALLVFTSLGLGMSFPYLIFSAFPRLLRFLPKPGNWMITFKELTGFLMIGTVLWLLWVFSAQTSNIAVVLLMASLFFISIGCWVFGKWGTPVQKRTTRYTSYILAMALFGLGGTILYLSTAMPKDDYAMVESGDWEPYSPQRVAELHAQGIPVFIDFTAKWCLTCQANHLVLTTNSVSTLFEEKGVVKMKADWTSHDPVITEALRQFGRNGVPLYIYFPPDSDPTILPQLLTPDIVIGAIVEYEQTALN